VVDALEQRPQDLEMRIICGPTGSAKTRVLDALETLGAQVLDLEGLVAHKGSVLGALPDTPQPSQKGFETQLYAKLMKFDPARPVFVEAESRKIGRLHLPGALIERMRQSECLLIDATREARIDFLLRDYAYLGDDVESLKFKLGCLQRLISNETLLRWQRYADEHALEALFTELIDQHYDPLYRRSQNSNYLRYANARAIATDDLSEAGIRRLAEAILAAA
jgi:tRNA 2-selenouridine synthase